MADPLQVRLVATDRPVWRGEAALVTFVTADGSIGIMPGHAPLLAILEDGPVLVRQDGGEEIIAAVHTGFALVDDGEVLIMAQSSELATEIDVERARAQLEEARASNDGPEKDALQRRAELRLKIAAEL